MPWSSASLVNLSGVAAFGIRPEKFKALTRPSEATCASARPIPPTPDMYGSTTFKRGRYGHNRVEGISALGHDLNARE